MSLPSQEGTFPNHFFAMKTTNRAVSTHTNRKPHATPSRHASVTQRNYAATTKKKSGSKKSSPKKSSTKKSSQGASFSFASLASNRALQVYGTLFVAFAVLLLVSICSFYFHADNNITFVDGGRVVNAENLARGVGAYLSVFFVTRLFGVFSIGFTFLFFLYGWKMITGKSLLPLLKATYGMLLVMAWLSIFFGLFFHGGENDFVSGMFGNYIAGGLLQSLGKLVTGLIVLLVFIFILFIFKFPFGVVYDQLQDSIINLPQRDQEEDERLRRKEKRSKHRRKEDEAEDFSPAREDLDDLYISDHGCLSKEYRDKNVFEFDVTEPKTKREETMEPVLEQPKPKMDEVPFELVNHELAVEDPQNDTLVDEEPEGEEAQQHALTAEEVRSMEPYDPQKDLSNYKFPSVDLLNDYPAKEAAEEQLRRELLENKTRIESTLKSFGIPIKKITATVGPTVTLYEIVPEEGVRISKIKNLEDDIALSLAALGIRIIAPIPGRGTIGIEVPNKNANTVSMKEIITSDKFKNNNFALPVGLGKTISNEPFVVDLAKMPHLLVAGATGQGKSVGLNAIITSLLYTKHPTEMKMVLIDPKKVEFTLYSAIENYFLAKLPDEVEPIITDVKKVVRTLNALCKEMDDRYDLLKMAKMRNIKEYNAKFCARELSPASGHRYLPYIVLIIDEFGDLIMTAGREVETPLARLAQLARAIGIHLVIATQRPSVNIITGSIKANFPARIAFRVQSVVDSRTILDSTGANQLIGKGDMLISTGSDLVRLQCAFVDTPEVESIANFIQEQAEVSPLFEPFELPDVPETGNEGGRNVEDNFDNEPSSGRIDPLFVEAAQLIVQSQQGSTSLIQRRMKLGYNRAGRIMDQMEEFGVVGPAKGSKPREVLVKSETQLREMLVAKGLF